MKAWKVPHTKSVYIPSIPIITIILVVYVSLKFVPKRFLSSTNENGCTERFKACITVTNCASESFKKETEVLFEG